MQATVNVPSAHPHNFVGWSAYGAGHGRRDIGRSLRGSAVPLIMIGGAVDQDSLGRRRRSPSVSACAAKATARLAASGESGRRISSCPQAAAGVRCCGFLERAGDSFQVVCPKRAGDSLRASSVFFDRQDQANMDFTHYQA
jgi:hypothetical protein